jgi:rsbT co-antagonist protein RsbR
MQTPGYPLLHAFLADRRSELLDRIGQELAARYPLLQQSAPPEKLRQMRAQFFDGFLQALSEGRCEPLAEPLGEVLLARIRTGMSLADSISVVGVVRRIFMRLVLSAIEQGVEDALPALPFVDEVLDSATARVAALHSENLARAQASLAQSEEQHRWLWHNLPAMMHSIDAEGRLCMVSDQWIATLGYAREEAVGRPSSDFLTPQSARYAREVVLPAFYETGRCDNVLYQFVCKDGRIIDVMLSAIAERDADGKVRRSQAVLLDVTERLRVERALAESEARYRDLVELSPDGVAVHRDGKFLYVNGAGARMLGFDGAQGLMGRDIVDLVAPALREGVRARVARAEAQDAPFGVSEEELVAQDGRTVVVEMAGAPVLYEGAPALQIVFRDVTERRRAEEVARRNEMQSELIRVQQEMLRALSTPLVPLGDGTLLMPLVGAVDGARADQIMAALLEGVVLHSAEVAILDVTGVPAMDASVAEAIAGATRAVKLLGARVILTGLSPAAARTLVTMGVDLGGATTHATVRDGIAAARRRLTASSPRRPG